MYCFTPGKRSKYRAMISFASVCVMPRRLLYEFTAPFVVASDRFERTFGLSATPTEVGIDRTVAWYRSQPARREA